MRAAWVYPFIVLAARSRPAAPPGSGNLSRMPSLAHKVGAGPLSANSFTAAMMAGGIALIAKSRESNGGSAMTGGIR